VSKGSSGRSGSPGPGGSGTELNSAGSPVNNANSTLNRPMASQSGTRYEDKTMQRGNNSVPKSPPPSYPQVNETHLRSLPFNFLMMVMGIVILVFFVSLFQAEEVPLGSSMPYPDGSHAPPPGAFRMYPSPPVRNFSITYEFLYRDHYSWIELVVFFLSLDTMN